ncbi:MAG: T9SS type A sorting domain-containing protein [Flavobacteriales bacterium]|nr:T9SS type A sorting domain-containing protein [Flavobacteriales bacterium]
MGYGRSTYYRIHRTDVGGGLSTSPLRSYAASLSDGLIKNPYPNPASDYLDIIVIGENVNINLLSVDGKLIERFSATGNFRLEVSNYGAGVYFLECTSGATREMYRVIFE